MSEEPKPAGAEPAAGKKPRRKPRPEVLDLRHKPQPLPEGVHLILVPDWTPRPRAKKPDQPGYLVTARHAWTVTVAPGALRAAPLGTYQTADQLEALLRQVAPAEGPLRVWLGRGWMDLVATLLAKLMDARGLTIQFAALDGDRCLFKGRIGEQRVTLSSLSAWTGGRLQDWSAEAREMLKSISGRVRRLETDPALSALTPEGQTTVLTVCLILQGCDLFKLGQPGLAAGGTAKTWWQTWGGLATRQVVAPPRGRPKPQRTRYQRVCLPCHNQRPLIRHLEPYASYGLVREQYFHGHHPGPVFVWDLPSAYLLALTHVALPASAGGMYKEPAPARVQDWLAQHTGSALCRVDSPTAPYLVRFGHKPQRTVGRYWTWLAGEDLRAALAAGHVQEIAKWIPWRAVRYTPKRRAELLAIKQELVDAGLSWLKPFWRQLYSARVGRWNAPYRTWKNRTDYEDPERWRSFKRQSGDTCLWSRCRVLAGQLQENTGQWPARDGCPVAYACVTAWIRQLLDRVRSLLPPASVLATAMDALWLTEEGLTRMEDVALQLPELAGPVVAKEVYEEVWMDGKGAAVVRQGGVDYPLLGGVPKARRLDPQGRVSVEYADADMAPLPRDNQPRKQVSYRVWDGGRLQDTNAHPLEPATPWRTYHNDAWPEHLLQPFYQNDLLDAEEADRDAQEEADW